MEPVKTLVKSLPRIPTQSQTGMNQVMKSLPRIPTQSQTRINRALTGAVCRLAGTSSATHHGTTTSVNLFSSVAGGPEDRPSWYTKVIDTDRQVPTYTTVAPGFLFWQHPTSSSTEEHQNSRQHPPSNKNSSPPVLVLLFTWLFCKPRSACKYAHLYTSRGCHVLQISSHLSHFLWPPNSKRFAEDIVKVLKSNFATYDHLVVHAMSIGAYNYTTCLMLADEKLEMKTYLFNKVRASVFDSLTIGSLDHMMHGIATGISQWEIVQSSTKLLAKMFFFLTSKTTVDALNTGVDFFKNSPLLVPTLIFASENDPMSDTDTLRDMVENWKVKAMFPVTFQVWERSGHCAHLIHHSQKYQHLLGEFLASSLQQGKLDDGEENGSSRVLSKL